MPLPRQLPSQSKIHTFSVCNRCNKHQSFLTGLSSLSFCVCWLILFIQAEGRCLQRADQLEMLRRWLRFCFWLHFKCIYFFTCIFSFFNRQGLALTENEKWPWCLRVSVCSTITIIKNIPACTYSVRLSNPVLSHRKLVCIKRFGMPAAVTARQQRTLSYAQLRHVRLAQK